jgi:hypothetical protein
MSDNQEFVIPTPLCSVKDGAILIQTGHSSNTYSIGIHQCNTYETVIAWVIHLSSKNWITPRHLASFIYTACEENRLKIPHL